MMKTPIATITAIPQLALTNLSMQVKQRCLFANVSLTLTPKQCIYLQGENGCGKTTLMRILAGLQAPTSGKVRWQTTTKQSWWHFQRPYGQVVYLHQHPYVFDGTVLDNLNLPLPQLRHEQRQQKLKQALIMADLEHLQHSHAHELSGGEKQRLAIARVWLLSPDILLLDEATANMDSKSQACIMAMVQNLVEQGTGLVISSHQHNQLTDLCQQTWHIADQVITVRPWQAIPETSSIIHLEDPHHA